VNKHIVLVIRKFDKFSALLMENGFGVINFPTIETIPVEEFDEFDKELADICKYDGVFLTSAVAAEIFLARFNRSKIFKGQIFTLGKRTKQLFDAENIEVFFDEKANTASDLIALLSPDDWRNKRFLFPCGDKSLRVVAEKLANIAEVKEVIVYQTVKPEINKKLFDKIEARLINREINFVCFFSPSGIENFLEIFGGRFLTKIKIAAIGETTAQKARENDLIIGFVSTRTNAEIFAGEFIEYLRTKSID